MSRGHFYRILCVLGASLAAAVAMFFAAKLRPSASLPPRFLSVSLEDSHNDAVPAAEHVNALSEDGRAIPASITPSLREDWIVYLVTGQRRERIWAIEHYEYDFVQRGKEPLRVFRTYLEDESALIIYKEHGATRAVLLRKDDPPPRGTGAWRLAWEQTLAEDGDLAGGEVTAADVKGNLGRKTLKLTLTCTRGTASREVIRFSLDGTKSETHWVKK